MALDQAAAAGHSPNSELALLAVHGVLHLLGHDHDRADRKAAMWEAQRRILDRLGLPDLARP
jgi:probable rRNA maturation factor